MVDKKINDKEASELKKINQVLENKNDKTKKHSIQGWKELRWYFGIRKYFAGASNCIL